MTYNTSDKSKNILKELHLKKKLEQKGEQNSKGMLLEFPSNISKIIFVLLNEFFLRVGAMSMLFP